jgi:hypothetical protein
VTVASTSVRAAAGALLVLLWSCGPRPIALPTGPATPFAEYAETFLAASVACRAIDSLTAEIRLSGRAAGRRVRGRLSAGLARPASLRLEALAPFGPPVFIFVAAASGGSLLFPREDLVLLDEPPEAIVEALAGVALGPDDLRAVLTGCLAPDPQPVAGLRYGSDWMGIELAGNRWAFLRSVDGVRRIVSGTLEGLNLEYGAHAAGLPRQVRLRSRPEAAVAVDLTIGVADLEANVPLGPEVFELTIPPGARLLTLEELRQAGPLADRP